MIFLLGVILISIFSLLFLWSCYEAFSHQRFIAPFGFLLIYLPFYLTIQIFAFEVFGDSIILSLLKYLKELALIVAIGSWLVYQRSFLNRGITWNGLDKTMVIFLLIPAIFVFMPLGEASFLNKLLYYKGFVLIGLAYLGGRMFDINEILLFRFWKAVFVLMFFAMCVACLEFFLNIHLQSLIPYNQYQQTVNELNPTGNYGLTWTFEASSGAKRFASFFASPLEFAPAAILPTGALLYSIYKPQVMDRRLATVLLLCCLICLVLAYSRAAMLGFLIMLLFLFFYFGNRQLLIAVLTLFLVVILSVAVFSGEEFQYFVIDTFTFSESSSQGHLIEWLIGLDSIITNPLGIGLAMSGNAQGVDEATKVGGENQFIIYGVQMGVFFILVYVILLLKSIKTALKAFERSSLPIFRFTFITAFGFKLALLVPLFFANVENYLYVSLISWFLIGLSSQIMVSSEKHTLEQARVDAAI